MLLHFLQLELNITIQLYSSCAVIEDNRILMKTALSTIFKLLKKFAKLIHLKMFAAEAQYYLYFEISLNKAVFSCFINYIAPLPIALKSSSNPQRIWQVL